MATMTISSSQIEVVLELYDALNVASLLRVGVKTRGLPVEHKDSLQRVLDALEVATATGTAAPELKEV